MLRRIIAITLLAAALVLPAGCVSVGSKPPPHEVKVGSTEVSAPVIEVPAQDREPSP